MKTDDLIQHLSRTVTAVTPLRPPSVRAAGWLAGAFTYLAAMTVIVLAMMGSEVPPLSPLFLVQQAAAMATGAVAAYGALASGVPGASPRWRVVLMASGAVWLGALIIGMSRDLQSAGTLGLAAETDWPCVASMTIGGTVLLAPMVRMLRRGAPLSPRLTALLGGVAALSIASIEACLTRPHAFTATVIIWHGATLVVLVSAIAWAGRTVIRWPADSAHLPAA